MCDKMAISAYILIIVEIDPFLRVQMRAKEKFNRHQFLRRKFKIKVSRIWVLKLYQVWERETNTNLIRIMGLYCHFLN